VGCCTNNLREVLSMDFIRPYAVLASLDSSGSIVFWENFTKIGHSFKVMSPMFK
jgi:hypothetical protein